MMNPYKEINWNPGLEERRKFARSLMIGFPCVAVLLLLSGWLHSGLWRFKPALYIGTVGVAIGLLLLALPGIAKPFYFVWYGIACAIGLVVGNILLGLVYYLIITSIGLIMRIAGRRPICKSLDRRAQTYWRDVEPVTDPQRYYRQF